ncbi:unnamed protein product [Schistosoma margrebowiei]|uniref:Integrase zinc-binding domain-containing protein n=1 Tax=Schistosoma margrebowiei TaxID=48269 RepID=A0A3P7X9B9_9TREM|nr:unnamed protein product [Schistosoma margrebowiei]
MLCIRVNAVTLPTLDLPVMTAAQASDPSCTATQHLTSLECWKVPLATSSGTILCDNSTGLPKPIVPSAYRCLAFDALHGLSHTGIAATLRFNAARYVWTSINKDVHIWVDRHGRAEIVSIDRLKPAHIDGSVLPDKLRPNARPIKPTSRIPSFASDPTTDKSETSFACPSQQSVSSSPSADEISVSSPDQQTTSPLTSDEITGSRSTNETTVSCFGRRVRPLVRFRD